MESIQTPFGKVELYDEERLGFQKDHQVKITITHDGCIVCTIEESAKGIVPMLEEFVKEAGGTELVPGFGSTYINVDMIPRPDYWRGRLSERLGNLKED